MKIVNETPHKVTLIAAIPQTSTRPRRNYRYNLAPGKDTTTPADTVIIRKIDYSLPYLGEIS